MSNIVPNPTMPPATIANAGASVATSTVSAITSASSASPISGTNSIASAISPYSIYVAALLYAAAAVFNDFEIANADDVNPISVKTLFNSLEVIDYVYSELLSYIIVPSNLIISSGSIIYP